MNSVGSLLKTKFSTRSIEEKCEIKKLGRPTPTLIIDQKLTSKGKEYHRYFNSSIYDKHSWICGCEVTNRFFCFPCLLLSKGEDATWFKTGVCDLGHLHQKAKKHESSEPHITACLDLSIVGKVNVREMLSDAYRRNLERQNDQVRRNRYILSKIIDCIKFCGAFELALRGHDETADSRNPGIFRGLVNFTAALDGIFQEHINSATVFKGVSKDIQNDLLECMLQVCQAAIKEEISASEFLAVISDETTDVSAKFQQVIVFRYVQKSGKPVERFWTFLNPEKHDAVTLTACIKESLKDVIGDKKEKLISQSYDGANVMSGKQSGVQTLIRDEYPHAYFVHCYAHQLNLLMVQAANQNREVRIFFANVSELSTFFSHSTQRTAVLDEIVGRRLPSGAATRWNFNSRAVLTIYENKDDLIKCMEKIESSSMQTVTVNQAMGLRLKMQQVAFNFWLEFFYKIMPHLDILYNQLQSRKLTADTAKSAIDSFQNEIKKVRDEVDLIEIEETNFESSRKRGRSEHQEYLSKSVAAKEVCDVISTEIAERFGFTGHLLAARLFDFDSFNSFEKSFPDDVLNSVVQSYPFLEQAKLKTELKIIYRRDDFKSVSKTTDLLGFFLENNLEACFREATKLLSVIITVPMTSSEAERCFSSLKRIKTFLRNTMEEERLSALTMLSIGKDIVRDMVDFNEKIIDLFASKKERRIDFKYNHIVSE